ncbi:uncharacterized protein K02A2.6-like [Schistocerca nitens]|uniref:uncharacterized protein K02A2.6-like n=1 Tax=Schistocerca nitens TaxID=7011 RepID=UPI002117A087|nr:uncharacterized protein K02A2.6-like [Schistocerca nitens]
MSTDCSTCAEHQAAPPQRYFEWARPAGPWQRVHIDFAGPYWNSRWLIVIDAFSNFPFVVPMQSTTSAQTIQALTSIFCIEGLPEVLVSDNGPQFTSAAFESFCSANGIRHVLTPPFHPQSNGAAERFVRTFKDHMDRLRATHSRQQALITFLSSYRTTPRDGPSPAELLHGRRHRTLLRLLHPPDRPAASEHRTRFQCNDAVFFRVYHGRRRWERGTVISVQGRGFYTVQGATGVHRRHQNQLRRAGRPDSAARSLSTDLVRGGFQPRLPTSLPPPGQQQQPSPLPRRQPVPLMPPAQLHAGAPRVVAPAPAVPLQSPPPSELMDVDPSAGPPSQAVAVQPVLQPLSLGTPKESDTAAPCPAPTQQPSTQRQEMLPLFVGPDAPSRPVPEAAPVVTVVHPDLGFQSVFPEAPRSQCWGVYFDQAHQESANGSETTRGKSGSSPNSATLLNDGYGLFTGTMSHE